jgi:hypothetical protein
MEQPCYKCGQVVEEGRPFCPHCAAPLIRVVIAEMPERLSAAVRSANSHDAADLPSSETVPLLALPSRWSQAFKPCLLAALVAVGMIMLHLYPFVAILSGGFMAVLFYRQGRQNLPLTAGIGAKLGALSGFLCFCILGLLSAVAASLPDMRSKMQALFIDGFQKVASARPPDPQLQSMLNELKTPDGFVMMLILFGIALLVVSLLLGVLGGALGGTVFRSRDRS